MLTRLHRLFCLARSENGASAVEFAMVMPLFATMSFALFELAMMLFKGASVQWAVDRAARYATITTTVSQTDIQNQVNSYLTTAGSPTATVGYTVDTSGAVDLRRITAHYDHTVSAPFVPSFTVGFDFETLVPEAD